MTVRQALGARGTAALASRGVASPPGAPGARPKGAARRVRHGTARVQPISAQQPAVRGGVFTGSVPHADPHGRSAVRDRGGWIDGTGIFLGSAGLAFLIGGIWKGDGIRWILGSILLFAAVVLLLACRSRRRRR